MSSTSQLHGAAVLCLFSLMVARVVGDESPAMAVFACTYVGVVALGPIRRALRARSHARAHRGEEVDALEQPLREGHGVVAGRVVYADDHPEAMRMEITQEGSETQSDGSWSHQWIEVHRELTVHPFFVVRGDGERIRVEPTVAESRLFDEIEDEILFQEGPLSSPASTTWRRTRAATLRPDEHVWVTGGLQRVVAMEHLGTESSAPMGYRESAVATSFVMRGDPSLLVSTVSLASHFRQRSRKHARHAFYLLMTLTVPSLVLANYMDRVRGETIFGAVETVDAHHGKHGYVIDYGARVRHARGTSDGGTFEAAPVLGSMLPVRVGEWSDNPGTTARLMGAEWTFAFLSCLVAMIVSCVTVGSAVNSLPWYRSDRVKLNEHGLGRLPRNPPQGAKAPSG